MKTRSSKKYIDLLKTMKCQKCHKFLVNNEAQYLFLIRKKAPICDCDTIAILTV